MNIPIPKGDTCQVVGWNTNPILYYKFFSMGNIDGNKDTVRFQKYNGDIIGTANHLVASTRMILIEKTLNW
jgi:hypothetical protein